jgi:hypothetical protein
MKRKQRRGTGIVTREPREIHVRMTAPRTVTAQPEAWVVKGRVIRFLDPLAPEDVAPPRTVGRRAGLWRTLTHRGQAAN